MIISLERAETPDVFRRIEELALAQEVAPEDIISDALSFLEIGETDDDALLYLAEVAERIGVTVQQLTDYLLEYRKSVEESEG